MKDSVRKIVRQNLNWAPLVSLIGLAITSVWISRHSQQIQNISNFQYGLNTCFSRVAQSYTAKLIGGNNQAYLSSDFSKLSEECFGESYSVLENVLKSNSDSLVELNSLSNDVHSFHEKLEASDGTVESVPESVILANLGNRFEKLELKKDSVLEKVDTLKAASISSLNSTSFYFYMLSALTPFFLFVHFVYEYKQKSGFRAVELESETLLGSETIVKSEQVQAIVMSALQSQGLSQTKKLYEVFNAREVAQEIEFNHPRKDTAVNTSTFATESKIENEKIIDEVWEREEKEIKLPKLETANIEQIASKTLDILSPRIFTQGIRLDVEIEEAIVVAPQEALEQIFFHLLSASVSSYDYNDPNKTLSLKMRVLGSTCLIDFYDSAKAFSEEFLKSSLGVGRLSSTDYVDFQIASDLAKDFGARVSFDNVANEDGRIVGRKVQLNLKIHNPDIKVSVQKGTKKDLLKRFSRSKEKRV